jgi:hypothetical protein
MSNLWNNKEYKLSTSVVITEQILREYINLFIKEVINEIKDDQHILFIPRVNLIDNQYITLSSKININKGCKEDLLSFLIDKIGLSNDAYKSIPISSIVFSYGIRDGVITPEFIRKTKNIKYQVYYNNKLPLALFPEDYGKIISIYNNLYIISVSKNVSVHLFQEKEGDFDINRIEYIKNGNILFTWKDKILNKKQNKFIRNIGKSTIHYEKGVIILYQVEKKTTGITKKDIPKNNQPSNKFITMDLETILINNTHIPYLLCWYDGKKSYNYFNNNPKGMDDSLLDMISHAMKDINRKKYKGYRIYLHNFAKFDGYFLLKYLAMIGDCKPTIHKGRIISTKFSLKNSPYEITFMDSMLLLPSSLRDLGSSFGLNKEDCKSLFPILLNNINYKGLVPDFKYFSPKIKIEEYKKYKEFYNNKIWNFKEESVKYCKLDCISLFQILNKFNLLIFNHFKINITKYPTLSSLAFQIFRTHFLVKEEDIPKIEKSKNYKTIYSKIHMLSGKIAENIRLGYTGGAVDMYIPKFLPELYFPKKKKKIYAYDVNSLYPYSMKNNLYPIGNPTYFEGDISKVETDAFGFFYCKITAPKDLKHPILQTHVKTKNGLRTIAALGTWKGMYFSEELYNSRRNGYEFEVLWGYTFKKGYIFKEYVDNLYSLRLTYPKEDPMNLISKLLLNSLYGRFGMNDLFTYSDIISKEDYPKFEEMPGHKESIQDLIDLGPNYLVQLKNPRVEQKTALDNGFETHNVNIAIASAVTAYARIHMSQFKNNPNFPNLYYTDTDSLYFDGPLPDKYVSLTTLGALKLVGVYDKAVFLAPKVYALKNSLEEIIKIKGLNKEAIKKNNITLDTLELLLNKDYKLAFSQNKCFKNISKANINILEQIYTNYRK